MEGDVRGPSLGSERTPGEGATLSSDASRRPRTPLPGESRRSHAGGGARRAGQGGPERCPRAGSGTSRSRPCLRSPAPTSREPRPRPSRPRPRPTCRARRGAPGSARPVSSARLRGAGRGRASRAEGGRGTPREAGSGEGAGLSCRPSPSQSVPAELPAPSESPRSPPARPACSERGDYLWSQGGRPLPGHPSLLLRKPPVQLLASRTGGAGTPGQGGRFAAGDM